MRALYNILSIASVCVALASGPSLAQQPDSLLPSQFSPLTIDQPRSFPPSGIIQSKPIPATQVYPSPPPASRPDPTRQPPINVRLVSAEESSAPANTKPPLRLAPRSQNGRTSLERPAAPNASSALVSVGGSLCVVLGIFVVIVWCTRRFSPPGAGSLPKGAVESLGRAPLSARQQMQLIRIGNKLLLVALSPTGVEPLTEITDPSEVENLLALCRRGQKDSSTVLFRQTLAQLANEPAPRGFVGPPTTAPRGGR